MNAASDVNLSLDECMAVVASPPEPPSASWRPVIVRLVPPGFPRLAAFCRDHGIVMVDTVESQLGELAQARRPSSSSADRQRFIQETADRQGGLDYCGNWVYLPWAARIVHLLDRDDFLEVITNRNRDKITRDEQLLLRTKRIGVIGLSVGAEAAVSMAQEHLCGEIVLADFDRLDLSNLNRLGAGVDELGMNKALVAARRIARIDPYLTVTVFPEGATQANLDALLDGLDLVIDECDDLRMKHEIRQRARAGRLNLIFAADERGFLSIEPWAHQPELPLFHGRIEAPQPPRTAFDTTLDFFRALTEWMGGWDRISERSRRSLAQVGTTLCGYPQLASEARYAAGQLGHVARRLLLGEQLPAFLGNVDLDSLLPAGPQPPLDG